VATQKPTFTVELEAGDYLVSVHHAFKRVWKIQGSDPIVGQGRSLRRTAVYDALRELTIAAELDEGIRHEGSTSARKLSDE
jgi:hypothetical protein